MGSGIREETLIAVVAVLGVAIWPTGVFVAAREPRHHDHAASTASLPERVSGTEESQQKAA
jgi:hypothetical protein